MTETLHRAQSTVPAPRTESAPATAPLRSDGWSQLTPERRRQSELEQLQIDLAAGR